MSKPGLIKRRRDLMEAQFRQDEEQKRLVIIERNRTTEQEQAKWFLQSDGVFLNERLVRQIIGPLACSGLRAQLTWRSIEGLMAVQHPCCSARELEAVLDSGYLAEHGAYIQGVSLMGRIEVYRFNSLSPLQVDEQRMLGFLPNSGTSGGGMNERFYMAQVSLDGNCGRKLPDNANTWPGHAQRNAWAAKDHDPSKGSCVRLEDAVAQGLEVGYDHEEEKILYVAPLRKGKKQKAQKKTTEAATQDLTQGA